MYLPCKLYANVLPNLLYFTQFKLVAKFSGVLNQKAFSEDLDAGLWLSLFLKTDKVLSSSRGLVVWNLTYNEQNEKGTLWPIRC